MFEIFEKAFLSGLGAIAMTQKMGEEFVKDLKEKYKVSEEEGKAFLDKMQTMAKESRQKVSDLAEQEVKKVVDKIGLVSREDYDKLLKRIEELENRQ
ncbi:poly(hydroxyalcanoate) granule associated protein [Geobacter sp. OR-1]|uniref:phasin family protein n=1 Tax=Geobacter sp. OR-1 TaxID=1266765 RepID=UPI000541E444|nr:phasin superfamily protein [Geobacter sp. OR-1]GAM11798.1 poly(hydroxyalcanoate) granule associated protein [Geobacter sp. OR-1]